MILRETVKTTMRSFRIIFIITALTLVLANPCCAQSTSVDPEEQVTKTAVFTLGPTRIEQKKILNMQGPIVKQNISLGKDPLASTVWVKSMRVITFDEQGPIKTEEFICHADLNIRDLKSDNKGPHALTQSLDREVGLPALGGGVVLPVGYGLRLDNLKSSAFLRVQTMNINAMPPFNVRYRILVQYIEDEDAKKLGLKNIHNVHIAMLQKDVAAQNDKIASQAKTHDTQTDFAQCSDGGHSPIMFTVPPGRHTYFSVLDRDHPLYKGGKILIYRRHMHIYGESVDLIDQTTGAVVGGVAPNTASGVRQNTLSEFENGVPIDPTHTYAIRTVYNNPTHAPVAGMALIHLYMADEK
jgi:hypothetical protein